MSLNLYNFAVSHDEAAKLVAVNGAKVTYVFEGEPGVGKTAILRTLEKNLGDTYDYIYANLPYFDVPNIALSMPNHETQTTIPYVNTMWYGTDKNKPKIVMLDEVFKCPVEQVRLMANRMMLERIVGEYQLPPGSIVFGTTNFTTDGVGDRTSAHTSSRINRVAYRKPTLEEWKKWAIQDDIDPFVLAWATHNPELFKSYKDTQFDQKLHDNNQGLFRMIFHPTHNNQAYVAPRTLELASHELKNMDVVGEDLTQRSLVGLLGVKAGLDLMAQVALGSQLPHPDDIVADPLNARIPRDGVAKLLMVFKSLSYINERTIASYAQYIPRLGQECMSTWTKTCLQSEEKKSIVLGNQTVRAWAIENSWIHA